MENKMKFKVKILTIMSFCLVSVMAFAQDAKPVVDVSGLILGGYLMHHGDNRPDPDLRKHGFDLERVYLTFRKDLGDNWSMRVTTDIYQNAPSEKGELFVRFAYAEYKNKFGDIGAKVRFGIIDNALSTLIDGLGGMRWLTTNQLDTYRIHNSSDLGASLNLNFFEFAELTLSIFNGEGHTYIRQSNEHYKGKEFYGVLSVTPIKNFYINAFYSYEKYYRGNVCSHWGGGLAWSDKILKVGVNLINVVDTRPYTANHLNADGANINGPVRGAMYGTGLYIDGWVNVNFQNLVGLPITFNGRVGYITPDNDNLVVGDDSTTILAFGPGYKFNDNVQFALWGSYLKTGDKDPDMMVSVKTEIKF
jgi:hypothetical protein